LLFGLATIIGRRAKVVREGFEPAQQYSSFGDSNVCAANFNAVEANSGLIDPDLATIIEAWPSLHEAVRANILAMVRPANGAE
jgi:hypothetical protein